MTYLSSRLSIPLPYGSDANTRAQRLAELGAVDQYAAQDSDLQTHKNAPAPHSGHMTNFGGLPGGQSGLDAARPAATGSGRLYWATDSSITYRDVATNQWQKVAVKDYTNLDNLPTNPSYTSLVVTGAMSIGGGASITGGLTIVSGGIVVQAGPVSVPSYVDFTQIAAPTVPTAGHMRLYPKADGNFYTLNSAGQERPVGTGSGSRAYALAVAGI